MRVSRWVIRSATDESEKRVVSNMYSEVFLVYHLDSNILAQLCDLKWFSRDASSAANDYKETASFSLGRNRVLMHKYK